MKRAYLLSCAIVCVLAACSEPTVNKSTDENSPAALQPPTEETTKAAKDEKTYSIQLAAGAARSLVYETSKRDEIVLLELYNDRITFTALISRRKFEEVMALKPPAYFNYQGFEYVRNDGMLFWGEIGKAESVSVDGRAFAGFALANQSQISAEGDEARAVLGAARSGDRLKLEKHYWDEEGQKGFPSFSLASIRDDLPHLSAFTASSFTVSESETRCRKEGLRKIVWIETAAGSFALNGQAMTLIETRSDEGTPWLGSDGRPVRIGRDVLGVEVTGQLIQAGLRKCK